MVCSRCRAAIKEGEQFCSQCGTKVQITCQKCGNIVENANFCTNCGQQVGKENRTKIKYIHEMPPAVQNQIDQDGMNELDVYEKVLMEQAKKESIGNTIVFVIIGILCLILIINNWGYSEPIEIVIMCAVVSFFVLAVYFAIAASMGFYGANKYLHKYRQLKYEIGKVEAVKVIEQQYNPNEGFSMLKGGIDATGKGIGAAGGCIGGCFSSIIGFALTIIMIILVMAFC